MRGEDILVISVSLFLQITTSVGSDGCGQIQSVYLSAVSSGLSSNTI